MNIGFDLDKVLINYPPMFPPELIEKFYKKKDNGILLYRIPRYPEQLLRKTIHLPILRQPIKKNMEFLKSISKKENKLYLISSRYKFLQKITDRLITKYGLDKIFDGLYFNYENKQPHLFKDEIIKGLHLDLYVDDDLSLIRHVAKNNPQTKFFWLNHSKRTQPLAENIIEISDLAEILK